MTPIPIIILVAASACALLAVLRRTGKDNACPDYVVSGTLKDFVPAVNRPGCILELTDGKTTGKYYVPLSPHDVRVRYPGRCDVKLRLSGNAKPVDGVYDTIGNNERLWDLS